MKRTQRAASRAKDLLLLLLMALSPTGSAAQPIGEPPPEPWVPGRVIVRLDPDQSSICMHCLFAQGMPIGGGLDELHSAAGVTDILHLHHTYHADTVDDMFARFADAIDAARQRNPSRADREVGHDPSLLIRRALNTYVLEVPDGDPETIADMYRQNPLVVHASPDYNARLTQGFNPTDQFWSSSNSWQQGYADLWGLKQIGTAAAWQVSRGATARVAVSDTGIERGHTDLAPNLCINAAAPAARAGRTRPVVVRAEAQKEGHQCQCSASCSCLASRSERMPPTCQ